MKYLPGILLICFMALFFAEAFNFNGNHTIIFKCGDVESTVDAFMRFSGSGMTVVCPKHMHLTGKQNSDYAVEDSWRVICECDK